MTKILLFSVLSLGLGASPALALETGTLVDNCNGCHYGQGPTTRPVIDFGVDFVAAVPGETVSLPVQLSAQQVEVFGVLVLSELALSSTETFLSPNARGIGHTEPLVANNGIASFFLTFVAPSTPGSTRILLSTVGATRNQDPEDDTFSSSYVDVVYGCDPVTSYLDRDGDGFGDDAELITGCEAAAGSSLVGGDCHDGDPNIFPGAEEICNLEDDNCDGERDEGLEAGAYFADVDGDGFGERGSLKFACLGPDVSENDDDCDDSRATTFPGAMEICNGEDDNCDGKVDNECSQPSGGGADSSPPSCSMSPSGFGVGSSWAVLLLIALASLRRRRETPRRAFFSKTLNL